jgi:hypothetical protein
VELGDRYGGARAPPHIESGAAATASLRYLWLYLLCQL